MVIALGVNVWVFVVMVRLAFRGAPALDNFRCCLVTFSPLLSVILGDVRTRVAPGSDFWFPRRTHKVGKSVSSTLATEKNVGNLRNHYFPDLVRAELQTNHGLKSGKTGASGRGTCLPGASLDRRSCRPTEAGLRVG